ncbi:hypothetical protein E4U15_004190 [Claviceps sp. LM218 group G6]|nr:hypothetical protein E4U15_004190 [Claviceps sp. LM218 group G6]
METAEDDLLQEPEMPGEDVLEQYIEVRTTDEHTPTMLEAIQYYHVLHIEACRKHKLQEVKELAIHKWIAITVNPRLMVLTAETATQYKELLNDARWANTSPDKWIEKWNTVYQKALRQNINEIQGASAIQEPGLHPSGRSTIRANLG